MLDARFGAENWNCGKPGAFTASAGTSMPSSDPTSPATNVLLRSRLSTLKPPRNSLTTLPEKIRVHPVARVVVVDRAVEQAQVCQPGAAIPPGAFERECVRGSVLPARADEDRVLLRELVVDATVSAFAAAIERKNLAVGAESAVRSGGLVRQRIEEVDDAARRRIDAVRRNAVTGERCTGHRIANDEGRGREVAGPHRGRGHDRLRAAAELLLAAAFVVPEEERPVRDHGPPRFAP